MKKILIFIPLLSILFFASCREDKEDNNTTTKVVESSYVSTKTDEDTSLFVTLMHLL